jgi:hypothetical protein
MSVWYIATGGSGGERIEGEEANELDRLKKELVYQQALKHVVGVPLDVLLVSLEVNVRDIRTNTVVHFYFDDHLKYYVLQPTKGPKYEFVNMDENGKTVSIEPAITAAIKAEEKLRIEETLIREEHLIMKENAGIISRESWKIEQQSDGRKIKPISDETGKQLDKMKKRLMWEIVKVLLGLEKADDVNLIEIDAEIKINTGEMENGLVKFGYFNYPENRYHLVFHLSKNFYYLKNTKEKGIGAFEDAQTIVKRLTFATAMASGLFASVGAAGVWKLYKQRRFIDI